MLIMAMFALQDGSQSMFVEREPPLLVPITSSVVECSSWLCPQMVPFCCIYDAMVTFQAYYLMTVLAPKDINAKDIVLVEANFSRYKIVSGNRQ